MTTAEFHTMRMQNGTRLLVLLEMRQRAQANMQFRRLTTEWSDAKFAEVHREYQRRNGTLDYDC